MIFGEYNATTNTWLAKQVFPGSGFHSMACFSMNNLGYVGTGFNSVSNINSFWEYNATSDTWTSKANYGGFPLKNSVGFAIGSKGYIATGEFALMYSSDVWEYMDDNVIGNSYSSSTINSNNSISDGAWTTFNNHVYASNAGNVGIGTSTPSNKLSVVGNADVDGSLAVGLNNPQSQHKFSVLGTSFFNGNIGVGYAFPNNKFSVNGNADISGNVGIGTIAPSNKLSVIGNADVDGSLSIGLNNPQPQHKLTVLGNSYFNGNVGIGYVNPPNKISVDGNADISGNVGIGTTTPTNKLSVIGNANISGNVGLGNSNPHAPLQFNSDYFNRKIVLFESANNDHQYFGYGINTAVLRYQVGHTGADHVFYAGTSSSTSTELMRITGSGKVSIGGGATPGSYKLYVGGGILTERLKVALSSSGSWADYVFADDYKLMPLDEVEKFVKEHNHLPNVPSADAMVESGIDVATIDAKLMEKIEELTLYMIEMKKEMKILADENASIQSQLKKK